VPPHVDVVQKGMWHACVLMQPLRDGVNYRPSGVLRVFEQAAQAAHIKNLNEMEM
jgi:hypothetical protein